MQYLLQKYNDTRIKMKIKLLWKSGTKERKKRNGRKHYFTCNCEITNVWPHNAGSTANSP